MAHKLVNIGIKQRLTRKYLGIASIAAAVFVTASIEPTNSYLMPGIILFALFFNGFLLIHEARHGVCPVNALRGRQSMDGWFSLGKEPFSERELLTKIRSIAVHDAIRAALYALIVSGAALILTT